MASYTEILSLFCVLIPVLTKDVVKIEILKDPPTDCSRKAAKGDGISMHYKGTLQSNGNEFDSSYTRNKPFEFTLGNGMVIQGWEQGVPGMCVGEQRRLTIPPSLGYGDSGFGNIIPAKSTLIFEIELLAIKDSISSAQGSESQEEHGHEGDHGDTFETIDTDGNGELSSEEMASYIRKFEEGNEEAAPEDSIENIVGEIFQEDDKNKDGVISYEEFQRSDNSAEISEGNPEDDSARVEL